MKVLFVIWGGLGLVINILNFMSMFSSGTTSIGVGTSSFASALVLLWIGGMVFFGLGSLVFRSQQHPELSPLEIWEGKGKKPDVQSQQHKTRQPNALDRFFGERAPSDGH
jgi:hypothetical protein